MNVKLKIRKTCTRISLSVFFIFLFFFHSFPQNIDENIQNIISSGESDSLKLEKILTIARQEIQPNREKSAKLYALSLKYIHDDQRKAATLDTIGLFNWQIGNYQASLQYFNQSLTIFEELQDSTWLGKVYNNVAVVNWGLGNSIEALNNYQTALIYRKAVNDQIGVVRVLNNIGIIYQDWGLYDEALKWHHDALDIAFKIKDDNVIAYSYSNIGNCYENQNIFDSALQNYQIGYEYLIKWNEDNRSNSYFSANIGEVYLKMNQLDSALIYFHDALDFAVKTDNQNRVSIAYYDLGLTYLTGNQLDSAKANIDESYNLAVEKNYTNLVRDNLFLLSKIAEKNNKTNLAFTYFKEASALKDSLFNSEKISKFTDLQIRYFTDQEKQENTLLRKNNEIQRITIRQQRLFSLGLIIISIFIFIILINIAYSRKSFKKLNIKLEKSEKELLKVNADKDKFFTIIAHDLKSPFSGLIGITDLLSSDYDLFSKEEVKDMIESLKESTSNVYQLLEGLLEWSQIQTDKIEYKFETFTLKLKADKIIDLFSASASNKGISLMVKIDGTINVYADKRTTSAILRNLVSNAIKFTNSGGKIVIEAKETEKEVKISVKDSGIGMTETTLKKLFNINEKVSEKGTAQESGTGLGLILCKEFVEKNGGKIGVKSTPEKGSIFSFTLPKQPTNK